MAKMTFVITTELDGVMSSAVFMFSCRDFTHRNFEGFEYRHLAYRVHQLL